MDDSGEQEGPGRRGWDDTEMKVDNEEPGMGTFKCKLRLHNLATGLPVPQFPHLSSGNRGLTVLCSPDGCFLLWESTYPLDRELPMSH